MYSAQYHPQAPSLVVTGGYDGLLRVWNLDIKDVNGQLLQEFEGHKTFINALCFDIEGTAYLCSAFKALCVSLKDLSNCNSMVILTQEAGCFLQTMLA